nr:MAG TPA: hypothetical protein [Caudoviricetes sp.]
MLFALFDFWPSSYLQDFCVRYGKLFLILPY